MCWLAPRRRGQGWSEARRGRGRAKPVRAALWSSPRTRTCEFGHLLRRTPDCPYVDRLAERGLENVAAHGDRLTRPQPAFQTFCFRRGKAKHGAVIEQRSIHFAALAMQRRGNPAAIGLLIAAAIRSIRRAIVDDALARRDIGDRDCIDERNRACAQSANRNLVARPDGKDDLSSEMRPQFYFSAVAQD